MVQEQARDKSYFYWAQKPGQSEAPAPFNIVTSRVVIAGSRYKSKTNLEYLDTNRTHPGTNLKRAFSVQARDKSYYYWAQKPGLSEAPAPVELPRQIRTRAANKVYVCIYTYIYIYIYP